MFGFAALLARLNGCIAVAFAATVVSRISQFECQKRKKTGKSRFLKKA